MDKTALLERLHAWNPWWQARSMALPKFRRHPFSVIQQNLHKEKVQVLAGPRQTGKTTLLRQLLVDLHAQGVSPSHTLYLPLDAFQDELQEGEVSLRDLLRVFSEEIAKNELGSSEEFIFLDEVHVYPKWNREIKVLHDQQLSLHFVVSGSASSIVLRDAAVALAGRSIEHTILPLTLAETLEGKLEPSSWTGLRAAQASLSEFLLGALEGSQRGAEGTLRPILSEVSGHMPLLRSELARYLRRGGFPEPALRDLSDEEADTRLQALLDQMIRRDFVEFFHVRDTKTLERTIRIVAQNTGRILSERKLSSDLGVAINTVRNHTGFLEKAYVMFTAKALAGSAHAQARIPEKVFFLDPGLRNSLVGYQLQDQGRLLESVVYVSLWAFLKKHRPAVDMLYWRQKDWEVDIVLRQEKTLIGIEVHKSDDDVQGLKQFLQEKPAARGILVSDTPHRNLGDRILVIAPALFLLL